MGKWYNKIFVGNPNKEDFTKNDLPNDRIDLYIDTVKLHFLKMVTLNVLYMAFLLPLILWTMFYWFAIEQNVGGVLNEIWASSFDYILMYLIVAVPLYAISGPAKAGTYYVLRNWSWGERAGIREHFWKEFKRSAKKSLLLNFIKAMVVFASVWWINLLTLEKNTDLYPWMPYVAVVIGVAAVMYLVSTIFQFPQLVTYNLSIKQIVKNSFIYSVIQLPRTLLAVLIYAIFALLCYFLREVLLVVMLIMGLCCLFLGQTIFSGYMFDKYVNPPELQRRGMRPKE